MSEDSRAGRLGAWAIGLLLAVSLIPFAFNEWRRFGADRARQALMEAHLHAGTEALESGDSERALLALRSASALDAVNATVRAALREAQVRVLLSTPERVSADAASAVAHGLQLALPEVTTGVARYHVALGNLALMSSDSAGAIEWYEKAVAADAALGPAQFYLGNALRLAGEHEKAEEHLRKAVSAMGTDARPRVALGLTHAARKQWAMAAEVLAAAVELEPDPQAYASLGEAELEQGRFEQAAAALEKALRGRSKAADAAVIHEKLGFARFRLGQHDAAAKHLELAHRGGRSESALFNLGVVRQAQQRYAEAVRLFARVVEADVTAGEAHVRLITCLASMGRTEEAKRAAGNFRALVPGAPQLQAYAARVREALGPLRKPAPGTPTP